MLSISRPHDKNMKVHHDQHLKQCNRHNNSAGFNIIIRVLYPLLLLIFIIFGFLKKIQTSLR